MQYFLKMLIQSMGVTLLLSISMVHSYEFQPRIVGGVESSAQDWPFMAALLPPSDSAGELVVGTQSFEAIVMSGAPARSFEGEIVNCGLAQSACTGVSGKVCLIQRGDNTFAEKVSHCAEGGGIAAIIFNNVFGSFLGLVGADGPRIPAVSISDTDGGSVLNLLGQEVKFAVTARRISTSFCGGSYIGGKWVLTAAHCVTDAESQTVSAPETIEVNIGGHNLKTNLDNVIAVKRVEVHQAYNFKVPPINDIALLELDSEPRGIIPVALASSELLSLQTSQGVEATALGRGLQKIVELGESLKGGTTVELFEVKLPLLSNNACNAEFNALATNDVERNPVTAEMMCAGGDRSVGTCAGDSGGPLLLLDRGEYKVTGLTSWGVGCAEGQTSDVYTRVPNYVDQINNVVSGRSLRFGQDVAAPDEDESPLDSGTGAFGWGQILGFALLAWFRQWFQQQRVGMQRLLPWGRRARRVAVLASASILLSACVEPAAQPVSGGSAMQRLEPLHAVSVDTAGVHITVTTTGCTRAEHFEVETQSRDGQCTIAIYRTKADLCRRSPMPVTFILDWAARAACGHATVKIVNTLTSDSEKPQPSGYQR